MKERIIDLTFPIHQNMMTFPVPWHPRVEVSILGRLETVKRETRKIVLGTHTGTHCDAPCHFVARGRSVDKLALDTLIGRAFLADFSKVKKKTPIGIADLKACLKGRRPRRLILRFDWSKHWGEKNYYSEHPFLTEEAARWLVARGVRLVGMDTPMPDDPRNGRGTPKDSPNHKIFLGSGIILVEYLCNLAKIRRSEFFFIALPLKIVSGDGAPARCVAIQRSESQCPR